MSESQRPLSPHLQIYRLPLLALLSITHRITGMILALAALLLPWMLMSIAQGAEHYAAWQACWRSWYGQMFLLLLTLALSFHLLNGLRHLCWDAGWNLQVKAAEKSAYWLLFGVIVLTALLWYVAAYAAGGV